MLSNHYPMTYSSPYAFVVVGLMLVAGALVRVFYNERHAGNGDKWWTWIAAAGCVLLTIAISMTTAPGAREALGLASLAPAQTYASASAAVPKPPEEVVDIVMSRCSMCHAAVPAWDGIAIAPKGVLLELAASDRPSCRGDLYAGRLHACDAAKQYHPIVRCRSPGPAQLARVLELRIGRTWLKARQAPACTTRWMMSRDFDLSSGRAAAVSSLRDSRRALLRDVISARFQRQTEFLAELVKVPSDNPPGDCAPHAERAAQLVESLGFHVERHRVTEDLVHAHGMISATNLVIRHRFGDGPTLALNAHGDVVAPGAGWSHDPYGAELVDGVMYGRGVAVSKSDFATYAFALRALLDCGLRLSGTVELHLTYDEEQGGEIGPGWLLSQNISAPDYAICAGFSYGVVVAHNGCLHLEVEVIGRSAHAAIPATGIDALAAATGILAALYAYRDGLQRNVSASPGIGAPQLTVGLISGGINTNVVPDRVVFRLDRRITPEENPETVEAEVRAVITPRQTRRPRPSRSAASCSPARSSRPPPRIGWRKFSAGRPPPYSGSRSKPAACRSIPMRAIMPNTAFPSCSMVPDRRRSRKPAATVPTNG